MAKKIPFKPCDELTPEDFEAFPFWRFDLDRGESEDGADETAATVRAAKGRELRGAVTFNFRDGRLEECPGVTLLEPRYLPIHRDEAGHVSQYDLPQIKKARAEKLFPLSYAATIAIGKKTFSIEGEIGLKRNTKKKS